MNDADALYLRQAIELSAETARRGNRPFGALIVSAGGEVLGSGVNEVLTTGDCTGHAELNALREASPRHSREVMAAATMYASGEPCVMCAGAISWSNIRRVVFAIDAVELRSYRAMQVGGSDIAMSCREVFAAAPHAIETIGPALPEEAAIPHRAYWKSP